MSGSPLVSIIINCFNGEKYLSEALDSVFAQTYNNWEIIFWDNASTDRSGEIAKSYGNRIKYFRASQTTPLGEARNLAMKEADGDLIAILDSDDIWLPHRLQKQIDVFWNSSFAVCYTSTEIISKDGTFLRKDLVNNKSGYIFEELLNQFDIAVSTLLIKRNILVEGGYEFDLEMVASEEYNLFMRMAAKHEFCVVPECLVKLRIYEGSLTGKAISRWAYEREYTLDKLKKENPGIEIKYAAAFKEAHARADYYKARYLVDLGQVSEARRILRKNIFFGPQYFVTYIILFFPLSVWQFLHRPGVRQTLVPRIIKLLKLGK
ncbi:hypothetical protein AZI86_10980 [Bdellovibrio bacteriovorus]|uniref:Glycosyltransferase 2-like domain-containing protein n=1 Tax=Bdellovibrio bacteriovorus TaxID=959 RepID=A0A150WLL6_BDEBC|nr:glycosyltransferase family 2 protein [Bdellovibrio bacteriovorus]KYG64725.1 hypothetical protein AZI86_10980 [Bdellovibrio bacteriovorus]